MSTIGKELFNEVLGDSHVNALFEDSQELSPELLGIVGSPTLPSAINAEGLAPSDGEPQGTMTRGGLLPGAFLLFIYWLKR